jgi:hypothetical protein
MRHGWRCEVTAVYIAVKADLYTFTASSPYCSRACGSVKPTVPIGGWLKTTVGILL